jgi:hypothetical protein
MTSRSDALPRRRIIPSSSDHFSGGASLLRAFVDTSPVQWSILARTATGGVVKLQHVIARLMPVCLLGISLVDIAPAHGANVLSPAVPVSLVLTVQPIIVCDNAGLNWPHMRRWRIRYSTRAASASPLLRQDSTTIPIF